MLADLNDIAKEKLQLFWFYCRNGRVFYEKGIFERIKRLIAECRTYKTETSYYGCKTPEYVFYSSSGERSDIVEHITEIYNSCDRGPKGLIITKTRASGTNLGYVSSIIKLVCNMVNIGEPHISNMPGQKKRVCSKMAWCHYRLWISNLNEELSNVFQYLDCAKFLITLNDCMGAEIELIERAKQQGKVTICAQEGMYIDDPYNKTILQTMYTHQTADYYLLWGNYAARLFRKYNSKCKMFICGDPSIKEHRGKKSEKWCIVCDVTPFHKYNQQMIGLVSNTAKNRGTKVDIRLHPQEYGKENTYKIPQDICEFHADDSKYTKYFVHTSTLYYSLLSVGDTVYRYLTDYSQRYPSIRSTCFSNESELNICIQQVDNQGIEKESKEYIAHVSEESSKRMADAFGKISMLEKHR